MVTAYVQQVMDHNHIEADIVKRIFEALQNAGNAVSGFDNGEETEPITDLDSLNQAIFSVEEGYINCEHGGWVRIVLGNGWDCLVDNTISLEAALSPVDSYIRRHW